MTSRIDVRITTRELLRIIADAPDDLSYDSLAESLECGRATVARHIALLQRLGYIQIERRWKGARYTPTTAGLEALNVRNHQSAPAAC